MLKCYKCGKRFTKSNTTPTTFKRRKGWCKTCEKEYRVKNKERSRLYGLEYYSAHQSERHLYQQTFPYRHRTLKYFLKKAKISRSNPLWSLNFFVGLLSFNECHYCLGPLHSKGYALDKVDPEKSYLISNIVPCCVRCNRLKLNHFSYREMMLLAPILGQIQRKEI